MTLFNGEVTQHKDESITDIELVGSSDGIVSVYSHNSAKFPVFIEGVVIRFTISSTVVTVTSDSDGNFTNANLNSGTISKLGVLDLDFSTIPDNGTDIELFSYNVMGLLSVILDTVTAPKQTFTLGTGDGVQTNFSLSVPVTKLALGQVRFLWKKNTVPFQEWDNGLGSLKNDSGEISSSTIVYTSSPNVNVTFVNPPDSGELVQIQIVDADSGVDWMQVLEKRNVTDFNHVEEPDGDGQKEVVIKNSGESAQEEIIVGLREYRQTSSDIFGIAFSLFKKWDYQDEIEGFYYNSNANPFPTGYSSTFNECSNTKKLILTNDLMEYWIEVDKDCIIVIVKVSGTLYMGGYLGQGLRVSSPSKYSKPQVVIGGTQSFVSASNSNISSIARIRTNSGVFLDELGNFVQFSTSNSQGDRLTNYNNFSNNGIIKSTTNNKVKIYPIYIINDGNTSDVEASKKIYFTLKKVFACPNNQVDSENTLDTDQYLIFQDVFRTDYLDYFAIKTN